MGGLEGGVRFGYQEAMTVDPMQASAGEVFFFFALSSRGAGLCLAPLSEGLGTVGTHVGSKLSLSAKIQRLAGGE